MGEKGASVRALVVYESWYGNTRSVAEAIAEGLG
jgi:flavodoxin